MKFVTRHNAKVDRIACPWLIRRFVDPSAEVLYVPPETVLDTARRENAVSFDAPGAELHHYTEDGEERVTFDAVIRKYGIRDPAVLDLAEIVRGADASLPQPRPESAGLEAMALGFRSLAKSDLENLSLSTPVYDALLEYCRLKVSNLARREHTPG